MTHSGLYLGSLRTFLCHGKRSSSTSARCVSMLILTLVHNYLLILQLGWAPIFCNMLHGLFHAQNMLKKKKKKNREWSYVRLNLNRNSGSEAEMHKQSRGTRVTTVPLYMCVFLPNPFSCVWLFATLWTIAHQASLSMGFSSHVYWSGLSCPPPGNLPDPDIKCLPLASACIGRWVLYH